MAKELLIKCNLGIPDVDVNPFFNIIFLWKETEFCLLDYIGMDISFWIMYSVHYLLTTDSLPTIANAQ